MKLLNNALSGRNEYEMKKTVLMMVMTAGCLIGCDTERFVSKSNPAKIITAKEYANLTPTERDRFDPLIAKQVQDSGTHQLIGLFRNICEYFEHQLRPLNGDPLDALVDRNLPELVVGLRTQVPEVGQCVLIDLEIVHRQSGGPSAAAAATAAPRTSSAWPAAATTGLGSSLRCQLVFLLLSSFLRRTVGNRHIWQTSMSKCHVRNRCGEFS